MTAPWRDTMRRALGADGGRDGVPMLLAVCDERPNRAAADEDRPADGRAVADLLDACRDALAPSARDDDLGVVITLLATVARHETEQIGHETQTDHEAGPA
ncbi:hypothetical protein [uncultured Jatrophihabitans sp.]|uniref:hypothetical protein n=1 Tax=uncultured Jatrophihabitans sp. TaxID=1610747 RepID=UPI0035CC136A